MYNSSVSLLRLTGPETPNARGCKSSEIITGGFLSLFQPVLVSLLFRWRNENAKQLSKEVPSTRARG